MTKRTRIAAAVLATVVLAAVAVLAIVAARGSALSARKRDERKSIEMAVGELPPEPSVWIDVHAPGKLWKWARGNAWLARAAAEPLGQGWGAGWAALLGTKGSDLAGSFQGAVLDLVSDKLLSDPFRVVYFAGRDATGAPAVVVPHPSSAALGAYDLLEAAARNGSYQAARCPGPAPKQGDQERPGASPIVVSRWLVAEQAVFAGQRQGRVALGKSPGAVLQALCSAPPDVPAARGIDVSFSFSRDALGRPAQLAAELLGLGPAPRLAFAVEGDRLEPRGLMGPLAEPGRLDAATPPDALLKLIPADAGFVLVATLRLPEKLTRATLAEHLGKTYRGAYSARPVAIIWNPRGQEALPTEVAVVWPERDSAALQDAFSGPNRMERRRACGHEVFASTGALAAALERSCQGRSPSILNAAPAVAAGLKQPSSIGLGVNFGLVLSRLLGDAYAADSAPGKKPPPEVESARRLLEELPFVGLQGAARSGALVPGGFRS